MGHLSYIAYMHVCPAEESGNEGGLDNLLNTNTKLSVNCPNSTWTQLKVDPTIGAKVKADAERSELKVCAATWQLAINRICITVSNEAIVEIS